MPVLANALYVDDPNTRWLYMIGRVKPGVDPAALKEKVSALVRQSVTDTRAYSQERAKNSSTASMSFLRPVAPASSICATSMNPT